MTHFRSVVVVLVSFAVAAGVVVAQPREPDGRYAQVLAGKTLVEGKGFPGLIATGDPTPQMIQQLGYPREKNLPFWYFYEKGAWKLTVVAEMEMAAGGFRTRAILVEGVGAPATSKGVKVGDAAARVRQIYGAPSRLDTSLGSPIWKNMVEYNIKTGDRRPAADGDAAFADSLFYPDLSTLFVIKGGLVSGIGVVLKDEKLPVFLRPADSVKKPTSVVLDAEVTAPKYVGSSVHVPPPPELAPVTLTGFTVAAPKGWKQAGSLWTSPDGAEKVEVRVTTAGAGETPAQFFAAIEAKFGRNNLPPVERVVPKELCDTIGAAEARALLMQEGGKGKDGQPLRHFVLMAAKGNRRYVVEVTRTATGAMPSPDGEALARGVMRGFKITP